MTRAKTLLLPADLDGVAAASLFEVLSSSVGTDIVIDGSRVEQIGGLCLQILLAAVSTWKVDGAVLEFTNLSLDLVAGLELLGICPQYFLDRELTQ
jgi:chemotaxis protein CheX